MPSIFSNKPPVCWHEPKGKTEVQKSFFGRPDFLGVKKPAISASRPVIPKSPAADCLNLLVVGGLKQAICKTMRKSNWIIFPKIGGEHKTYLKAPPRFGCFNTRIYSTL